MENYIEHMGGGQPFFDTAWPVVMQWFNEDH